MKTTRRSFWAALAAPVAAAFAIPALLRKQPRSIRVRLHYRAVHSMMGTEDNKLSTLNHWLSVIGAKRAPGLTVFKRADGFCVFPVFTPAGTPVAAAEIFLLNEADTSKCHAGEPLGHVPIYRLERKDQGWKLIPLEAA